MRITALEHKDESLTLHQLNCVAQVRSSADERHSSVTSDVFGSSRHLLWKPNRRLDNEPRQNWASSLVWWSEARNWLADTFLGRPMPVESSVTCRRCFSCYGRSVGRQLPPDARRQHQQQQQPPHLAASSPGLTALLANRRCSAVDSRRRRRPGICLPRKLQSLTTQPCIRSGSLNRVPASATVRAGMSPLLWSHMARVFP